MTFNEDWLLELIIWERLKSLTLPLDMLTFKFASPGIVYKQTEYARHGARLLYGHVSLVMVLSGPSCVGAHLPTTLQSDAAMTFDSEGRVEVDVSRIVYVWIVFSGGGPMVCSIRFRARAQLSWDIGDL